MGRFRGPRMPRPRWPRSTSASRGSGGLGAAHRGAARPLRISAEPRLLPRPSTLIRARPAVGGRSPRERRVRMARGVFADRFEAFGTCGRRLDGGEVDMSSGRAPPRHRPGPAGRPSLAGWTGLPGIVPARQQGGQGLFDREMSQPAKGERLVAPGFTAAACSFERTIRCAQHPRVPAARPVAVACVSAGPGPAWDCRAVPTPRERVGST